MTMAGLSLIGTYSSGSDNDDEDSDDHCDKSKNNDLQIQTNLPLPQSILTWKGVDHHEEIYDDPNDHDGRTRSFKHERGNWVTLVYVEYKPEEFVASWMKSVSLELPIQGKYLFHEFHLSLTRTLILKFHWIESFVASVKNLCQKTQRFFINLGEVEVYCNDDRTRTFLAIRCTTVDDSLEKLTESLNKVLDEYQLPPFYEDASFHISFMWYNGDVEERLKSFLPSLTMTLGNILLEHSAARMIIDRLHCKIGNKMYAFQFQ